MVFALIVWVRLLMMSLWLKKYERGNRGTWWNVTTFFFKKKVIVSKQKLFTIVVIDAERE